MKDKIINKITNMSNNSKLKIKKYSPEILLTLGIAGTITATVMACKATTKASEVIKKKRIEEEDINTCISKSDIIYSEEDGKKDLKIINIRMAANIIKIYAPAASVMCLSIGSIIAGNKILKRRNAALLSAYAIVDSSYKKYRKNVVEKFGKEVDKELKYNLIKEEIKTKDKNGKTKKEVITKIDKNYVDKYSEYARFFDDACNGNSKDPEYNLMFLRRQQDYANEMLKAKGHMFLNEVYDLLDIPRTKAGQIVGWVYDEKNPIGDNYIDFNIYDITNERARAFVNGNEYSILLDFNVDGAIYDLI